MVSELTALKVQPRTTLGKKVKALRRQGATPIHLYGKGISSQALQVDSALLRRILLKVGRTRPVSLEVEGQGTPYTAFVRDILFHPMTESILHVDFYGVPLTEKMEAEVPVSLVGEAPAVRMQGGSLAQVLHTVTVECLPLEIPSAIQVDVSFLDSFDKVIRVADLVVPPNVKVLTEPEQAVAYVAPPRAEEEVVAPAPAAEVEVIKEEREEGEEEAKEESEEEEG